MNKLKSTIILAGFCLLSVNAWAVSIQECEDELGNKSFQQHCPPGSKSVSEKQYPAGSSITKPATALPTLVLYTVPDCEVCDDMREFFSRNNITVSEKNIKDNGELQQELKSKTGGDLRVPVLLIGEKVIAGYDAKSLTDALTNAGYLAKQIENQ